MARTYRLAELSWGNSSMKFSNTENDPEAEHYLTALKGWFGGVGVKGENQARMGHGDFPSENDRGPRPIVIEATLVFQNEDARDEADRFVSGILWNGKFGNLRVTIGDRVLSTPVKLDGDIAHAYVGTKAIDVQIPLLAPDPFLYADPKTYQVYPSGFGQGLEYPLFMPNGSLHFGTVTADTQTIITNRGNATAWPKFIIRGDFPSGVLLTDGRGNTIELPTPIYRQSPVTIDMTGSVLINGYDNSSLLTQRDWFYIEPGESLQPRVVSLQEGSGWVDIELSDTYF